MSEESPLDEFVSEIERIYPCNTLKTLGVKRAKMYLNTIGTCARLHINCGDDVKKLSSYHLVWYTENGKGESGFDKENSFNYTLHDFANDFINKKLGNSYGERLKQLKKTLSDLRGGLRKPIDIRVAYDSTLKKAVVVDGVKRVISLYYFMLKEPNTLSRIFSSEYPVYILKFVSDKCQDIFPCDFKKIPT